MTKIFTTNTVTIDTPTNQISVVQDSFIRLTASVQIHWVYLTENQRFLFYKWQESSDGGETWSDIPSGTSLNNLSKNLPDNEKRYLTSSIENQNINIQLVEFNIFDSLAPKTFLEFDKVYLNQNNYRYRCTVILYNSDLNTIESAASTDPIVLNVVSSDALLPLQEIDIPWDPMNPFGIIKGGKVTFDADTEVLLWDPNYNPASGTQWRIIDTGTGTVFVQGSIANGVLSGLPPRFGPNDTKEPRFMELQNGSSGTWNTLEVWTSKIGDELHTFKFYGGASSNVELALNGETFIENIVLGSENNPTIIKPNVGALGVQLPSSPTCLDVSYTINTWNCCGEFGTQTITVPDKFVLPVTVTITGGVDDDLMVNGQIINQDNSAGPTNHTFVCNTRTFTIGGWNSGGGQSYGYTICFSGTEINAMQSVDNLLKQDTSNILTVKKKTIANAIRTAATSSNTPAVLGTRSISATIGWQNTNIPLTAGRTISITATGTVNWMGGNTSGPDGIDHPYARVDDRFLHEALLGRIGEDGPIFLVGSNFFGISDRSGDLYLATNDVARSDNSGSFSVTIAASPQQNTDISCPNLGFLAFDGSGRRFLYATYRDDDNCFIAGNNNGLWATDGGYILRALCDGRAEIVYSQNWFAEIGGYLVGNIVAMPDMISGTRYISPTQRKWDIPDAGNGCGPIGDSGWTLSGEVGAVSDLVANEVYMKVRKGISIPKPTGLVDPEYNKLSLLISFADEPLPVLPPAPTVTPTPAISSTPTRTPTPTPTSSETPTPTPTETITPTPTISETPTPTPTSSTSPAVANFTGFARTTENFGGSIGILPLPATWSNTIDSFTTTNAPNRFPTIYFTLSGNSGAITRSGSSVSALNYYGAGFNWYWSATNYGGGVLEKDGSYRYDSPASLNAGTYWVYTPGNNTNNYPTNHTLTIQFANPVLTSVQLNPVKTGYVQFTPAAQISTSGLVTDFTVYDNAAKGQVVFTVPAGSPRAVTFDTVLTNLNDKIWDLSYSGVGCIRSTANYGNAGWYLDKAGTYSSPYNASSNTPGNFNYWKNTTMTLNPGTYLVDLRAGQQYNGGYTGTITIT